MHFWRSHAAWGSQKKTIPMQHGKAETENCDTSRARTSILTEHHIFVVVIFLSILGRQTGILAGSLKENLKMMKIIRFFENCENQKCC